MAAQGYMQRRNPLRDIWERLARGGVVVAASGVVTSNGDDVNEALANKVGSPPTDATRVLTIRSMTQTVYDNLPAKDTATLYVIVD